MAVPICSCYSEQGQKYEIGQRTICFSCVLLLLTDPRLKNPKQVAGTCSYCRSKTDVVTLKFKKRICDECLKQARKVRLAASKDVLASQLSVFRNRPVSEIVNIRHQALTYLLAHSHLKNYAELSKLGKEMLAAKPKDDYLKTVVYERLIEAANELGQEGSAKYYGYKHAVMLDRIARSRQIEYQVQESNRIEFGIESVFLFYGGRTTFTSYIDRRTRVPSMFPATLVMGSELVGNYCFWLETSLSYGRPLKAELELTDVLLSTEGIDEETAKKLEAHDCKILYPSTGKLTCV